jgi:hypothetical protein
MYFEEGIMVFSSDNQEAVTHYNFGREYFQEEDF